MNVWQFTSISCDNNRRPTDLATSRNSARRSGSAISRRPGSSNNRKILLLSMAKFLFCSSLSTITVYNYDLQWGNSVWCIRIRGQQGRMLISCGFSAMVDIVQSRQSNQIRCLCLVLRNFRLMHWTRRSRWDEKFHYLSVVLSQLNIRETLQEGDSRLTMQSSFGLCSVGDTKIKNLFDRWRSGTRKVRQPEAGNGSSRKNLHTITYYLLPTYLVRYLGT